MSRLVFDIETNGFLNEMNTIHCLVIQDYDTGKVWSLKQHTDPTDHNVADGVHLLMEAEEIVGHNIIRFDIPAIQKIYPWFQPKGRVLDTLIMSRMFWPDLAEKDAKRVEAGTLARNMVGKYSLEAFGQRLGVWKGDYAKIMEEKGLDPWACWSQDMQDYCEQDVTVNSLLFRNCLNSWHDLKKPEDKRTPFSDKSIDLEMKVGEIVARQERWGFAFDVAAASKFYVTLVAERERLGAELKKTFKPWLGANGKVKTPSKDRKISNKDLPPIGHRVKRSGDVETLYVKTQYFEGASYTAIKEIEFNPQSNKHISDRLIKLFGWQPLEYTPSGEVKVDETVLATLPWEEAKLLTTYLTVCKRIGQLAEGKQAWLKKEQQGRIHGSVMTVGAVTRRMTHNNPNVAQVPKVHSKDGEVLWGKDGGYGAECRSLFTSTAGFVLVGCDADALELRCLAGYMARYDGGAYIETVLSGNKSEGTDMHSVNCRALGLDPQKTYQVDGKLLSGRDIAKTWFYAFIYGAGDWKLGVTMGAKGSDRKIKQVGRKSRTDFLAGLPALGKLSELVKKKASSFGFLKSLDGARLTVRSEHSALNTLLQSAGAIIMKVALVILDNDLQSAGLRPSVDYEFCANIHDEWQIDVRPEHVEFVMKTAEDSIRKAGVELDFRCPLAGNADTGPDWKATH